MKQYFCIIENHSYTCLPFGRLGKDFSPPHNLVEPDYHLLKLFAYIIKKCRLRQSISGIKEKKPHEETF